MSSAQLLPVYVQTGRGYRASSVVYTKFQGCKSTVGCRHTSLSCGQTDTDLHNEISAQTRPLWVSVCLCVCLIGYGHWCPLFVLHVLVFVSFTINYWQVPNYVCVCMCVLSPCLLNKKNKVNDMVEAHCYVVITSESVVMRICDYKWVSGGWLS